MRGLPFPAVSTGKLSVRVHTSTVPFMILIACILHSHIHTSYKGLWYSNLYYDTYYRTILYPDERTSFGSWSRYYQYRNTLSRYLGIYLRTWIVCSNLQIRSFSLCLCGVALLDTIRCESLLLLYPINYNLVGQ